MDMISVKEFFQTPAVAAKCVSCSMLTSCISYDNLIPKITTEYFADRVRIALNREAGERPALSRSCNAESPPICHWETGKAGKTRMQSQKNCPIGTLYRPCERQEGTIIFMCFVCLFAGEQEGFLFCGDCNGKAFFTGFPMTLVETKCGCIRIRTCFPKCIAVFIFFYEKGTD